MAEAPLDPSLLTHPASGKNRRQPQPDRREQPVHSRLKTPTPPQRSGIDEPLTIETERPEPRPRPRDPGLSRPLAVMTLVSGAAETHSANQNAASPFIILMASRWVDQTGRGFKHRLGGRRQVRRHCFTREGTQHFHPSPDLRRTDVTGDPTPPPPWHGSPGFQILRPTSNVTRPHPGNRSPSEARSTITWPPRTRVNPFCEIGLESPGPHCQRPS